MERRHFFRAASIARNVPPRKRQVMRRVSYVIEGDRPEHQLGVGQLSRVASPMPASLASTIAWDRVLTPSLEKMLDT